MEKNEDKKSNLTGKLQLKKTFNAGQIKQSFSHGRSRSVSVEVKKRRTLRNFENLEVNEEAPKTEKSEDPKFSSDENSEGKPSSDEESLDSSNSEKDNPKRLGKKMKRILKKNHLHNLG